MALFESATEQGIVDLSDDALFAEAGEAAVDQESNDNGSQGAENAGAEISTEEPSEQQVEAPAEEANKEPDNVQYRYWVKVNKPIPEDLAHELGISQEDLAFYYT